MSAAGTTPPQVRRALLLPLAALGGAALAGAVWLVGSSSQKPAETPATAAAPPAPTAEPAEPAAPAAPAEVEIVVVAKPADARILLDGAPVAGNPFAKRLPRDGGPHTLRVEAPGYLPDTRTLTFDKDLRLELALEKEPPAARPPSGGVAARQPPPPPPPSDDMKRPTTKPVRPLDTTNPFTTP